MAPKKLLVCAPSNAAVDELVMRFKAGVKTLDGQLQPINVVRLGRTDAVNSQVLDVTLEELINKRLDPNVGKTNYGEEIHKLVEETRALGSSLELQRQKLAEARAAGKSTVDLDRQYDIDKRKKGDLGKKIDELRDKSGTASRDAEINRRKVQQAILDGAHIICATLSGSGHEMFHNLKIEFDTVVIDEAAQSIELSALIPLKYGCSKCILVGDPKQLPPTVLSREAARFSYEQSLFVRMQTNHPDDVHLLDTQYRMHPEISQYPSQAFYDGRLLDGAEMASLRQRPWHRNPVLGPYQFFDVEGQHQSATKGHSLVNRAEVLVALQLFERLRTDHKGYDYSGKIGIITPYKGQLMELKIAFKERYGDLIFQTVEFNTTDAFQGRESEIIIFSCVRASANRGIGFLDDIRRMNVGLTRAKCSLWVLGNSPSLQRNEFWGRLIDDARRRNRYRGGDVMRLLQQPFADMGVTSLTPAGLVTTSKTDEVYDVAMTDAPTPVEPAITPTSKVVAGSSSATRPTDATNTTSAEKKAAVDPRNIIPKNMAYTCGICGSGAHFSFCCDNLVARETSMGACWRCRAPDHIEPRCAAPLCTVCGEIGHTKVGCVSRRPLSKSDQFALLKRERQHEQRKQAHQEKARQRQVGDHDPKVPVVRTTVKTPPLEGSRPAEKRKRAPSDGPSIPLRPANVSLPFVLSQAIRCHSSAHPFTGIWLAGWKCCSGIQWSTAANRPKLTGTINDKHPAPVIYLADRLQAPMNGARPGPGPPPQPGWRGPAPRRPPKKVDPFIRPKRPRPGP